MDEPIHETRQAAITWVKLHTHHEVFSDYATKNVIRVDADTETVLMLQKDGHGYFWAPLREI